MRFFILLCLFLVGCGSSNSSNTTALLEQPNFAPIAYSITIRVYAENSSTDIMRASDANHDPLTFSILNPPVHGTISVDGGAIFTYHPKPGFIGTDIFSFVVNDLSTYSNEAYVRIQVIEPPLPRGNG